MTAQSAMKDFVCWHIPLTADRLFFVSVFVRDDFGSILWDFQIIVAMAENWDLSPIVNEQTVF